MPDTPAATSIDVVGSDSVEVSFEPPISDGGSPLTSFTVSTSPPLLVEKYVITDPFVTYAIRLNGIVKQGEVKSKKSQHI